MDNEEIMEDTCEVLIVGAGIAGLSFALYLTEQNPDMDIILISKGDLPDSNTRLAQGGIAAVTDESQDSFTSHIIDTLLAGNGLSNSRIVTRVIHDAPERISDLLRWGILFDRDEQGFHLNREGGHTVHRILHHKDFTGKEIHHKLLQRVQEKKNIRIRTHCFAIDLHLSQQQCGGIYCYSEQQGLPVLITAKITMLATGGSGQMFQHTTNASCATGDGVAMAVRAGAKIKDMPYYQFHPTALYQSGQQPVPLITEAIRGYGAHLINSGNRRFLFHYDLRGELATRDVVTRAIYEEMEKTGAQHVYLSVKHLNIGELSRSFPSITQKCKEMGLDVSRDPIPVVPAAHYQCGGIAVDEVGRSSIPRLFAGGECACTGLHGSNRLASNSLLEALVFAYRSASEVNKEIDAPDLPVNENTQHLNSSKEKLPPEVLIQVREIRKRMQEYVTRAFHHKDDGGLLRSTLSRISFWKTHFDRSPFIDRREPGELRNLLENATLLLRSLLEETKNPTTVNRNQMNF